MNLGAAGSKIDSCLFHPASRTASPAFLQSVVVENLKALMRSALEITWVFSPKDLFEEQFSAVWENCVVTIGEGKIVAAIPFDSVGIDPALRAKVERKVTSLFLGVQVVSHVLYELSRPEVVILHEDGSRELIIECVPQPVRVKGCPADIRCTEADGAVVDTRRERIDRKIRLSRLSADWASNDDTLIRMLRSYGAAIRDPSDELIHLYEVRESLASRFGSKPNALRKLRQPDEDWSRLGGICNDLPLRQGRHRGKFGDDLRDATEQELAEARNLAASFIEAYLRYLSAGGT